jgi:multidrug efflux pump
MLSGVLALFLLPVSQYPEVAPPTIQISATYLGASASTTEETVTQVIEQNITGIDNMIYMKSTSDSNCGFFSAGYGL